MSIQYKKILCVSICILSILSFTSSTFGSTINDQKTNGNPLFDPFSLYSDLFTNHHMQNIEFPLAFDYYAMERLNDIVQTSDGEYIAVGSNSSYDLRNVYFYIVRLDNQGERVWEKNYEFGEMQEGMVILNLQNDEFLVGGVLVIQEQFSYVYKMLIMKIDDQGQIIWQKQLQADVPDIRGSLLYDIRPTEDGGYIITGTNIISDSDVLLAKIDADGNELWCKNYHFHHENCGVAVQQTNDQGYLIVGYTSQYEDIFDIKQHAIVIKTNATGTLEWNTTVEMYNYSYFYDITPNDQSYLCLGSVAEYNDDQYSSNIILMDINEDGTENWMQSLFPSAISAARSISPTNDSGFVICGITADYYHDDYDVLLLKIDNQGSLQWNTSFSYSEYEYGYAVQQTQDLGFILAGCQRTYSEFNYDALVIKVDEEGMEQWHQIWGSVWHDDVPPIVNITKPTLGLYFRNSLIHTLFSRRCRVFGSLMVTVDASEDFSYVSRVEFYINGEQVAVDYDRPYEYPWIDTPLHILPRKYELTVKAYDCSGNEGNDTITVWRSF